MKYKPEIWIKSAICHIFRILFGAKKGDEESWKVFI
jgi:hypothetical protein